MGIKDRSNPEQNIFAGARYLAQVRDMIPERIPEPDRTWLTIAAYNVGFGHLEDARIIAQAHGKNPDSWSEVRERLPLLAAGALVRRAPSAATRAAGSRCSSSTASSSSCTLLEWQPGEAGSAQRRCSAPPALAAQRRHAAGTRGHRRCADPQHARRDARSLTRRQLAAPREELLQQPRALLHQHPAEYVDAMIEAAAARTRW